MEREAVGERITKKESGRERERKRERDKGASQTDCLSVRLFSVYLSVCTHLSHSVYVCVCLSVLTLSSTRNCLKKPPVSSRICCNK